MRLDALELLPNARKFRLRLSDGSTLRLPQDLVLQHGLSAGMELTEEELSTLAAEAGRISAKQRAVRILAASGTSEKELYRKLVQKGEKQADAAAAVAWLEELDLLDDASAAKQIVARESSKGYGRARIRQVLFQKGIPKEYWEEALALLPDPSDYISRYLDSHLPGNPDQKLLKKVTDALLRKGYSWEQVRSGLQQHRISSLDGENF